MTSTNVSAQMFPATPSASDPLAQRSHVQVSISLLIPIDDFGPPLEEQIRTGVTEGLASLPAPVEDVVSTIVAQAQANTPPRSGQFAEAWHG